MDGDVMTVRAWMDQGTELLLSHVDAIDAADPTAATIPISRLPGWTRAHLLAHIAFNAEALQRLLSWARTGVETPMYPSTDARDAEIEQGARQPLPALIDHVHRSAADLDSALDALPVPAWDARVRTAQGRDVPAREVVWMRTREVWVHAVDLAPDAVTFHAFPRDLLDALITDVVAMFTRRGQATGLSIEAVDAVRSWQVGPHPAQSAPGQASHLHDTVDESAREDWSHQDDAPEQGIRQGDSREDEPREDDQRDGSPPGDRPPEGGSAHNHVRHEHVTVRGELADVAGWLTGRADGAALRTADGRPLPHLPAWL